MYDVFLCLRKVETLNLVQEFWILNTLDMPVTKKIQLRQTIEEVCCKESHNRNSINVLLDKRTDNRHAP